MTKKKMKNGKNTITHILLSLFAFVQIYPLFWLFEFSLKDNSEIFGGNIAGLPQHWRFGNYVTAFFQANIMQVFFQQCSCYCHYNSTDNNNSGNVVLCNFKNDMERQ